jgi:cysteine-rich repeat protein
MAPPLQRSVSMLRPAEALTHPLWLGALAVHLLNDHWWKGSGLLPGAVTGKLSDVAVLITTPAVLAVLVGARTPRAWRACHAAMGALFVALELSDAFTALFRAFVGLFGFGWVTWRDWTDLLTLPALLVSATVLGAAARRAEPGAMPSSSLRIHARRALELALVGTASLTCLATSSIACPVDEIDPDDDRDGAPYSMDCDDDDPTRYRGAVDVPEDGIDQDCDGVDTTLREDACVAGSSGPIPLDAPLALSMTPGVVPPVASCIDREGHLGVASLRVPAFDAPVGRLRLQVDTDDQAEVALLLDCRDPTTELYCATVGLRPLGALVRPGELLVLVVQGASLDVRVSMSVEPIRCGDGLRVDPEACDDGNLVAGDGCDPSCELEADEGAGGSGGGGA